MSSAKLVYDIKSKSIMKSKELPKSNPSHHNDDIHHHHHHHKDDKSMAINRIRSRMKYDEMKKFLYSIVLQLNGKNNQDTSDSIIERISIELDFDKEILKTFILKRPKWPKNLLSKFVSYINTNNEMLGISTLECRENFKRINSNSTDSNSSSKTRKVEPISQEYYNYLEEENSSETESDHSSETESVSIENESNFIENENSNSSEKYDKEEVKVQSTISDTDFYKNVRDMSNRVIFIPKDDRTYNKEIKGLKVFISNNEIDRKDQVLASIPKLKLEHFIHEVSNGDTRKEICLKNFFKTIDVLKNCIESNYDDSCDKRKNNSTGNSDTITGSSNNNNNTDKQVNQGECNNTNTTESNPTKGYQSYPYGNNNNNLTSSSTTTTSSNTTTTTTSTTSKISSTIYELENILLKSLQSFLNDYVRE